MRPSRRLGGVVLLLLLSASGCAGVQSRMNGSARNPEEAAPSRSSGWFGSRFWARPTPTSASAAAGTAVTPDADTARPTAPETDIWPGPRSSGLSRLFPMLGNRDRGKKTPSAGDVYPTLASLSTPAAAPDGSNDRQVRPVSGDEAAKGASTRQQAARTKAASTAQGDVPELLPSPIAVRVPVKLHDRPESRGAVALEVEPADLNEGDEATRGTSPRDLTVSSILDLPELGQPAPGAPARNRPRREAYLIATAASAADLTTTGGDEPAQPSTSSPQPAPSAVSQQPKRRTPKPPTTAPSTTPPRVRRLRLSLPGRHPRVSPRLLWGPRLHRRLRRVRLRCPLQRRHRPSPYLYPYPYPSPYRPPNRAPSQCFPPSNLRPRRPCQLRHGFPQARVLLLPRSRPGSGRQWPGQLGLGSGLAVAASERPLSRETGKATSQKLLAAGLDPLVAPAGTAAEVPAPSGHVPDDLSDLHARAPADRPDGGRMCPTDSAVSASFHSTPLHLHRKGAESAVLFMVSLWNGLGLLRQGKKLATRLRVQMPRLRVPTLVGELQALCEQVRRTRCAYGFAPGQLEPGAALQPVRTGLMEPRTARSRGEGPGPRAYRVPGPRQNALAPAPIGRRSRDTAR